MHKWKDYLYSIYSKLTGILLEYIHGRQGAMVEAKNGSKKTTVLHVDTLKKLLTSSMGIGSHHSLDRNKLIVAETSAGGSRFWSTSSCRHSPGRSA